MNLPAPAIRAFRVWAVMLSTLILAAPTRAQERLPEFGEYVYVDELPEAVRKVPPNYPQLAREAGVDGTVQVQALIGADGHVKDTRVVKSIPMLDVAAVAAVMQWTFKPARKDGAPVAVWVAVPVRFSLDPETHDGQIPPPVPRDSPRAEQTRPGTFEEELASFRRSGSRIPSHQDRVVRERVIRAAQRRSPPPLIPDEARERLDRVRAAMNNPLARISIVRALEELGSASWLAPWWAEPYREIAGLKERSGEIEGAILGLKLY
ncbi:MAG TPA: energy transducer TonB, partial [Candidatus Limnocylindria bacterium]|nr:energy transducer TonB [Candidatus Limnocylindria bacterium]